MSANHKEGFVSIEGLSEPIRVVPGSFVSGRYSLHKAFYPTKSKNNKSPLTLWRKLQILEKMQNLNIESHTKHSMITIANWKDYQQVEQQLNNRRTTTEQQLNTNKNVKNDKNNILLYDFYNSTISPSRKSRARAMGNISYYLKQYPFDDLQTAVLNYHSTSKDSLPKYKKDPANFFGKNEPFILDFLPGRFRTQGSQDTGSQKPTKTIEQLKAENESN